MQFSYNYLNLLQSAGETNYTYSADGTKLSVKNGANGFDYLGSLILSNGSTEFQFSDGVINKTTGGYAVNYFLRDHLGSVRTVVDKDKNILQQSDYYPFGLKQERADYVNNSNRFLYNGKELQTTGNLGVLDYGARMYDGEFGRWFGIDPLAEKYNTLSPYNYCANTPFNAIDVDGRLIVFVGGFSPMDYSKYLFDSYRNKYYMYGISYIDSRGQFTKEDKYGWDGVDKLYKDTYNDNNALYIDGDDRPAASAKRRYDAGKRAAERLLKEISEGITTLAEDEKIRLVGHSMGAAYAAGMGEVIMNSSYADRLEFIDYLAPHQPDQFSHPNGVLGRQYGSERDRLSSRGKAIGNINQLNKALFGTKVFPGGHTFGDGLYDFVKKALKAGAKVTVTD